MMGELMNCIKKLGIEISAQHFGDLPSVEIEIRKSEVAEKLLQLKAALLKVSIEEAALVDTVPGLQVEAAK
jgi:hypothetical protein